MNRLDARWARDMPVVDSTESLPIGSGWLRGIDADGTYPIQSQTVGGYVQVSQDDADAGGLELRPGGDTAAPCLPHRSPEMVKLISELPATDVGWARTFAVIGSWQPAPLRCRVAFEEGDGSWLESASSAKSAKANSKT